MQPPRTTYSRTYKDLLAHLLSWAAEFRQEAEMVARGESFDYTIAFEPRVGPTAWNQAEVDKRRAMSLGEMFDAFDAEVRRLQDMLFEIPRESLLADSAMPVLNAATGAPMWRSISQGIATKCMHDRYHLAQIRSHLESLAP